MKYSIKQYKKEIENNPNINPIAFAFKFLAAFLLNINIFRTPRTIITTFNSAKNKPNNPIT